MKLGLVREGVYWKLKAVLYGLRSGPKRWGIERDRELASRPVTLPSGVEGRCVQCESCRNLWMVVSKEGEVVARFLVYVDDIVVSGSREWVQAVLLSVAAIWTCKINGILVPTGLDVSEDGVPIVVDGIPMVSALTFLGVTLEYVKDALTLHQHAYIVTKLDGRNRLHGQGKASLPTPTEGKLVPEKDEPEFEKNKKEAQREVGTIQWLSLKSRPDISTVTAIAASCIAHNPREALRLCDGIWKYLGATWEMRMFLKPSAPSPQGSVALWPLEMCLDRCES